MKGDLLLASLITGNVYRLGGTEETGFHIDLCLNWRDITNESKIQTPTSYVNLASIESRRVLYSGEGN
jgi:hypothetical protein